MKRLSSKFALAILIGMIIILLGNIIMFYKSTTSTVQASISNVSMDMAESVSSQLDVGRYKKFIETPAENETYWQLREALDISRLTTGALYVYTMQVTKDNEVLIYIDGQPKGSEKATRLGDPTSAVSYEDIKPALKGETSYTAIAHDEQYGDYLSAFAPIFDNGKVIGVVGVDVDASKVSGYASSVTKSVLPIFIVISVILIGFVMVLMTMYMKTRLKPLQTISKAAEEMAEGSVLNAKQIVEGIQVKGEDEIRVVTDSFKRMTANTSEMVTEIKNSSNELLSATNDINKKMSDINQSNEQIVSAIQQVAVSSDTQLMRSEESVRTIEDMALGIQKIAESSAGVSVEANEVTGRVKGGYEDLQKSIDQITSAKDTVQRSSEEIQELGRHASQIEKIVDMISSLAEQTNLLALNAAIEAARAGEHGKGFAVVSEEVRKLAEESKRSSGQITSLILQFKATIEKAVLTIDTGAREVEIGTSSVIHAGDNFHEIQQAIEKVSREIQEVSAITEEMSAGSEEIAASVEEFASLSKESANMANEVASSTDMQHETVENIAQLTANLQSLSNRLSQSVGKFKV